MPNTLPARGLDLDSDHRPADTADAFLLAGLSAPTPKIAGLYFGDYLGGL